MGVRLKNACECQVCGTMFRADPVVVVDMCAMCEASMLRDAMPEDAEQVCACDAAAEACLSAADRFGWREVL